MQPLRGGGGGGGQKENPGRNKDQPGDVRRCKIERGRRKRDEMKEWEREREREEEEEETEWCVRLTGEVK